MWPSSRCNSTAPRTRSTLPSRSAGSTSTRTTTCRSGWTSRSSCARATRSGSRKTDSSRDESADLADFLAEEAVDGGEQVVVGGDARGLERDARLGKTRLDQHQRGAAGAGVLAEQRLQLGEPVRRRRLDRHLHFDPGCFGGAHLGEARDLVDLDLRSRLRRRLLLRLGAELLRQADHPADEDRIVSLEQLLEALQDVLVEHHVTRAGQILQHGETDLLAGLGQALPVARDDAADRDLLESLGCGEGGAGVRRVPLHVVGVPRQRVAGDVEAERLLLLGKTLALDHSSLPKTRSSITGAARAPPPAARAAGAEKRPNCPDSRSFCAEEPCASAGSIASQSALRVLPVKSNAPAATSASSVLRLIFLVSMRAQKSKSPAKGLSRAAMIPSIEFSPTPLIAPSPNRISFLPALFGSCPTPNARSESFTSGGSTVMPSGR